jgi:hypothetical protein
MSVSTGKHMLAHRYSYSQLVGEIPAGLLVCHHCDNPICVRPEHFFVGTDGDNSKDKVAKGRAIGLKGEDNPRAILTEEDVREIRRIYKRGSREYGCEALGRRFGVSAFAIHCVVTGKGWKHVV